MSAISGELATRSLFYSFYRKKESAHDEKDSDRLLREHLTGVHGTGWLHARQTRNSYTDY